MASGRRTLADSVAIIFSNIPYCWGLGLGGNRGALVRAGRLRVLSLEDILVAYRAERMLAGQVAVLRADRERRGDGDIGKREPLERAAHQLLAGLGAREPLRRVEVEHGAAGVFALELVLVLQRLEGIVRVARGQLR